MSVSSDVKQNGVNGLKKVYTEEDEDGTLTEYHEEVYTIEGEDNSELLPENSGEIVIIQDDPDIQIYRQHAELPDGREMITTTTVTVNEFGERTEEQVTEIIESEEVEVESEGNGVEPDGEEVQAEIVASVDVVVDQEEVSDKSDGESMEPGENDVEAMPGDNEATLTDESPSELGLLQTDAADTKPSQAIPSQQTSAPAAHDTDGDESVGKRLQRHISYEEFAEQFTEYKPPKRYEKKQVDKAADKAAPKISIMSSDKLEPDAKSGSSPADHIDKEGLPSNDYYSTTGSTTAESLNSPRSGNSIQGDDSMSEEMYSANQPTRTQGTVIRRMDQGISVDPANVVRAEDKPDLEAELPARGTSNSLKKKFQSMGNGHDTKSVTLDYSRQGQQEKPRTGLYGYAVPTSTSNADNTIESDHKEPEFEGGEIENVPVVRDDVVRETDRKDEEELPESGYAKSLLSKFKKIEKESEVTKKLEYRPSGVGAKPTVTPLRPQSRVEVVNSENYQEPEYEGGEFENEPEVRADVIKESDVNLEEELPSVGITRSLLSSFKQKEEEAKKAPTYQPSGVGNRPPRVASIRSSVSNSPELHREPQFEDGERENTPILRTDVVRETDCNEEDQLPEIGYTRNLKARLEQLRDNQTDYVEHRPSGVASKATPTPLRPTSRGNLNSSSSSLSVDDDELDDRIEPQVEGGEFENQPIRRTDVIREEDRCDEEELPEAGLAGNLLNRFRSLESHREDEYKPSGVGSKPTPTPLRPAPCADIITEESMLPSPEGGEFENHPLYRTDVIRESDTFPYNDLPEEGLTRRNFSHYEYLADSVGPDYVPSGVSQKATPSRLHIMAGRSSYDVKGTQSDVLVTNGDADEPVIDSGEYENTPEVREDVVNESSAPGDLDLPVQGVTKNLKSKFSSLEEQNKSIAQHKPSGVANKPTPTPLRPESITLETDRTAGDDTFEQQEEQEVEDAENTPEINHNVIRSTDTNKHDYIPSPGAAKTLLDKFKQLETQKNDRVEHRPSKVASLSTPTPLTLKR